MAALPQKHVVWPVWRRPDLAPRMIDRTEKGVQAKSRRAKLDKATSKIGALACAWAWRIERIGEVVADPILGDLHHRYTRI